MKTTKNVDSERSQITSVCRAHLPLCSTCTVSQSVHLNAEIRLWQCAREESLSFKWFVICWFDVKITLISLGLCLFLNWSKCDAIWKAVDCLFFFFYSSDSWPSVLIHKDGMKTRIFAYVHVVVSRLFITIECGVAVIHSAIVC